jgi:hypothetical protein
LGRVFRYSGDILRTSKRTFALSGPGIRAIGFESAPAGLRADRAGRDDAATLEERAFPESAPSIQISESKSAIRGPQSQFLDSR